MGPTSGVSGASLTPVQVAEIGGLANVGGQLISMDAADLSNKLDAVQGAIWSIEYTAAQGYTITATDATVQGYMNGYIANAALTASQTPVYAIYGATGQGLLPASNPILESLSGDVPEPASWAMMLTGMGVLGGTLRRRRVVAAY